MGHTSQTYFIAVLGRGYQKQAWDQNISVNSPLGIDFRKLWSGCEEGNTEGRKPGRGVKEQLSGAQSHRVLHSVGGGSPGGPTWGFSMGGLHGVGMVHQGIRGSSMGVLPGGSPQAGVLLGVLHGIIHVGALHWVLLGVFHGGLHGFSRRLCRTCFRAVLQRSKETSGIYKPIPFSYCLKVEYINTLTITVCP